jgi:hypothetical protein
LAIVGMVFCGRLQAELNEQRNLGLNSLVFELQYTGKQSITTITDFSYSGTPYFARFQFSWSVLRFNTLFRRYLARGKVQPYLEAGMFMGLQNNYWATHIYKILSLLSENKDSIHLNNFNQFSKINSLGKYAKLIPQFTNQAIIQFGQNYRHL